MFLRLQWQASGAATTGTGQGTTIGAVAGGIAETIANAAVKDATFVAITDMQISEKAREGVVGRRDVQVDAQQGMGGSEQSTFTEETTEKRCRTRVISTANKAARRPLEREAAVSPAPRSCCEAQGGRETGDAGIGDSVFDRRSRGLWPLSGGAGGSLGTAARGIRRRSVLRSRKCCPW